MQRWFFADEAEDCDAMAAPVASSSSVELFQPATPVQVNWKFWVQVNQDLAPNERLAIVGSTERLGNWQFSECIVMMKEDDKNLWYTYVSIPRDTRTEYRYLVVAVDPTAEKTIVRNWEAHLKPRSVIPGVNRKTRECDEEYGYINGVEKVDRGWVTSETIVQLKFFNAPFTWKQRMKRRLIFVKVTPMNLTIPQSGGAGGGAGGDYHTFSQLEDSLSNDTHDTRENGADLSTAFAFNEVAVLQADESVIKVQPQFGTACGPDDVVIFHLTIGDFDSTAYLIDLYSYSSKAAMDEPPYHLGYHYVLPNLLKRSDGNLEVPITCATRHRPMGMMQIGYLLVKPTKCIKLDMALTYTRYWNPKWTGLDVGHRGSGTSFKTKDSVIRENTITSLKNAVDHGADMVEFDVQLSKDLVPVVYHDFMIYVSLKAKGSCKPNDFLELPMRELTLDQLNNLKVYHTQEGRTREERCFHNDDQLEHQPFPSLADVLDAIDQHVGFNIEVKWSQRLKDGTMEEEFEHTIDRNLYVDCILNVVFRKAGDRRIVFSCFDPDICTMLRFKQNRYPVMFLTLGETTKYQKYLDPRGNTIEMAIYNSLAMELLGIVAHTEDLLRDPTKVNLAKSSGLVVFCWGDDNNCKDTIKFLKELGLHAIIYDKMDVLTSKEVKQSVFLLQAKESQNEILKLQALERGKLWHDNVPVVHKKH
ncbi:glycerophosphocholine phosphodiesterase GPCPD1 [Bactrocera tryoni]|uniref:glycerophosphocholine phosphodiesterase GPCPD1 n=1 Tax=Bactrocera tryoni TaxID=59916 RepID=UPI001A9762DF|nr:glycerophosphocholine phosphodiesterase GPCPD1 [Bactrocera tryoni]XP_039952909.1 glycerophosphocholine phosphodiesterase GPCPD1 [Bactrocera tryoni]